MPIGIMINSLVVFVGGFIGAAAGKKIPEDIVEQLPSAFGLSAIAISVTLIARMQFLTPVVTAIILGTIIGELLGMEQKLKNNLEKFIDRVGHPTPHTTEILTTVIVLFCFSGTGLFGALNEGFTGDGGILVAKSVIDFFTAIIFGAVAGRIVGFVALPQFLIAMVLFASAGYIVPLLSPAMLNSFESAGGIITLGAGLKVARIKNMRVVNMLPALLLAIVLAYFWEVLLI